jgi:hypothetical protein
MKVLASAVMALYSGTGKTGQNEKAGDTHMEKPRKQADTTGYEHMELPLVRHLSPFGRIFRFIGSWLGFAGLYSAFSVCPICGQQGCPVGIASAGAVGAFLALCVQDWKTLFRHIRNRFEASSESSA